MVSLSVPGWSRRCGGWTPPVAPAGPMTGRRFPGLPYQDSCPKQHSPLANADDQPDPK
jgi:hypothetical protein